MNEASLEDYEFETGMLVTVVEGKEIQGTMPIAGLLNPDAAGSTTSRDTSFKGEVLEITAIDLPYIVVDVLSEVAGATGVTLDVRERIFRQVTAEFAEAQGVETDGRSCRLNQSDRGVES